MPRIDVNGTTLAYEDLGPKDGVPLVFSHSLFFDREMFRHHLDAFTGEYRVVAYDHRGQGGSAAAPIEQLDMDTLTEDAAALMEALELGRSHVLGNSMGGFVALRLAARRPDLVRSAVALGSSAEQEHQLAAFAPVVEHLQQSGPAGVIDTLMHIMFGDTSLAEGGRVVEHWRERMLALPTSIGDAAHQVIHRRSIVDELRSATVPVLAVAGEQDHAYPPPVSSDNIVAAVPDGRQVTVPDAGHSVSLERADVVEQHLREHFQRVDAAV